jgi:hypothetical protein
MANPHSSWADRAIRWTTTFSVVVLAGIAAVLSYKHMFILVRRYGETSWTSTLLPVSVDGMIAASSMTLLADSRNGQRSGLLPWSLLVIGSAASLAANVAVAEPSAVGLADRRLAELRADRFVTTKIADDHIAAGCNL